MDMTNLLQATTTVGFPIVMCGAMGYFVKYTTDKHREEINKINDTHREEMQNVTNAVNNNTIALTKLCEKIES